eukprot:15366117-Ditylum_brightwellii.AAC.1
MKIHQKTECSTINTSGEGSVSSHKESYKLLGEDGGGKVERDDDSDINNFLDVPKKKRKDVLELDDNTSDSDSPAFENIQPKK